MGRAINKSPVAESIPFDNDDNDFDSDNVQEAIEEIGASASPGFSWGRSGELSIGTWLLNESVPSQRSGRVISLDNPVVARVYVTNRNIATYEVSFYEHDGNQSGLTFLGSVNVVSARGAAFSVNVSISSGRQLATRITDITSGIVRDVVAGIIVKGDS